MAANPGKSLNCDSGPNRGKDGGHYKNLQVGANGKQFSCLWSGWVGL
jgi:hypothetical protein